ncbi:putative polymerase with PALM domain, HD hydrolase domain and Zn ribbon [Desulfosporosinus orientis DSM 765]|uniref:Putative polymerase with PALM domain, HD hydrolase domain and Zn ribbon n=1 Tax=Desulfosporosinus orientis (strain ATCC 19365 / DSM 765 / NCIMB 8382 / VKM B-1628 / Singapore I) TaxID=768706 RepID=G7WHV8_DESOD|nr:FapA family protein [Desulfosporosinus orientis]AET70255.1 putative polymerase with PALM domain, HD hydrolase domain and Zn ribbon [Desulfosporosinus orientis DSM 765]
MEKRKNGVVGIPDTIIQTQSIDNIKEEWANKLNILPEDIALEVLNKPGFFSRQWKVRLIWQEQSHNPNLMPSQVIWDGSKYLITLGEGVKQFIPFWDVGEVKFKGIIQDKPFRVSHGDQVEFYPLVQAGFLTWELEIRFQGLSVAAKVKHELPGHYILPDNLPVEEEINLAQYVTWESLPAQGEIWDEAKLNSDLEHLNIVHGRRKEAWKEIMDVKGSKEVVVAEATLPIPPVHARLEDFVGAPQEICSQEGKKIDFLASKVKLVEKGSVLARKIPGRPGVPGKDVLGKDLPASSFKDFQFRVKKNVSLSADELEVISACAGQPIRIDERTYMVEHVYVLNQDVDIATGSIEFPGDVFVNGNVQDGLRVFAQGKIEIRGSVSHAEIRAEKGALIHQNLLGGKIIVGEKFVVRSELLRLISELQNQLGVCLRHTADLAKTSKAANLKPGQCLKLIIEKQYAELPKLANRLDKFIFENKNDELITEGLIVTSQTAKRFLTGLGPLEAQSIPLLQRVNQAFVQFAESLTLEIPDKLSLVVSYAQGATIECGGAFECHKGTYNSNIRVEGDVTIEGVCRGGKIFAGGRVQIRELGGSEVSSTYVQISPESHLSVNYCHANVVIAVGKEIIQIEEPYRNLEIYRDQGRVQIEKLKANPID